MLAAVAAAARDARRGRRCSSTSSSGKQEARNPFYRVVELTDDTEDPAIWGKNFPQQYDGYRRTVDQQRTRYGGSEAVPRHADRAPIRARSSRSRGSRRIRG